MNSVGNSCRDCRRTLLAKFANGKMAIGSGKPLFLFRLDVTFANCRPSCPTVEQVSWVVGNGALCSVHEGTFVIAMWHSEGNTLSSSLKYSFFG